jgi:hypothetical protein
MIFKRKRIQKISPKKDSFNPPKQYHEENKIYSIALVLDGEIQDIIRTEERLWALLMSQPVILDISDLEEKPQINWTYNEETGEFKNPNAIKPTDEEDTSSI